MEEDHVQPLFDLILNLRLNSAKGRPSPHKYIFLLSLIKIYENDVSVQNKFPLDSNLESIFKETWLEIFPDSDPHTIFIEYPFYHLVRDGIWGLKVLAGKHNVFDGYIESKKRFTNVCKNLELLNLPEEAEQLKKWVNEQVRNSQVQAEAARLIQEVDSWLTENSEVFRIVRIAQIRSLLVPGKEFEKKLKTAANKVSLSEMDEVRSRVALFIKKLKEAESKLSKKADALWDSEILTHRDISPLLKDVKGLMLTYEGCDTDLEDLELMALALNLFHNAYIKLNDTTLSWDDFSKLSKAVISDADDKYGDNDPPPWDIQETLDRIIDEVTNSRRAEGQSWLEKFIENENEISTMSVKEADSLMRRLQSPPAVLTDDQKSQAISIAQKAKERCQELEVDWLVQKFTGLTNESKNIFLEKIRAAG